MQHDYTAYEYLPECKDGCGKITEWMQSKEIANEAGENHGRQKGHRFKILERMRE